MREDPRLDVDKISACLKTHYGLCVTSVTFLPIGYDQNAAVYEVASCDGGCHFLKVRFGPVHEPSLLVPRTLRPRDPERARPLADAILGPLVPAR